MIPQAHPAFAKLFGWSFFFPDPKFCFGLFSQLEDKLLHNVVPDSVVQSSFWCAYQTMAFFNLDESKV